MEPSEGMTGRALDAAHSAGDTGQGTAPGRAERVGLQDLLGPLTTGYALTGGVR